MLGGPTLSPPSLWFPYRKDKSRRHTPNPSGASTGGDQSQAGLIPGRGAWQGLWEVGGPVMVLPSVLGTVHGYQGSVFQLLFAVGGSSSPACPTTWTSPATALRSGETPTGLSKDLRLPRGPPMVGLWALPLPQALDPRCPAPDQHSFLQVEWLYPWIPNSRQH